jgi:hypothetical protein
MASYISSNNNRFYVATEAAYGVAAAAGQQNRIPAVKFSAKQAVDRRQRRDKTGTRTFLGDPSGFRLNTSFELGTYMTGWTNQAQAPPHGPLFQAAFGAPPALYNGGGTVTVVPGSPTVTFTAPHGLVPGQAFTLGGEIRFVSSVANSLTLVVNAPFSGPAGGDAQTGASATYQPATALPSVTVYDFWDPSSAVQRILYGAAINKTQVRVNGDFHEFVFSGQAADLIDSSSFTPGQGGLNQYPAEPTVAPLSYSIIPGHLGEVWLGAIPTQFLTLTSAELTVDNGVNLRATEFGSTIPSAIAPGERSVSVKLSIYQMTDTQTQALYQAARQRSPMSMMLQLGQQPGELFGMYMSSMVPEVPEFNDKEVRLQWNFSDSRAQGIADDEVYVAFG